MLSPQPGLGPLPITSSVQPPQPTAAQPSPEFQVSYLHEHPFIVLEARGDGERAAQFWPKMSHIRNLDLLLRRLQCTTLLKDVSEQRNEHWALAPVTVVGFPEGTFKAGDVVEVLGWNKYTLTNHIGVISKAKFLAEAHWSFDGALPFYFELSPLARL